ncbi:hypothetical protein OIU85_005684 [Salix viminalis]|uniref:Auxin-responsive protein n=1 Tax=Salix viminalis TaxID=40686 RepID=A0A9Q0PJE9_SALVM|nr:hypothetical protein OIU85_005684 [Salix viminalis]
MATSVLGTDRADNYKETELCLGLPGAAVAKNEVETATKATGKRGFAETVDLKLHLQAKDGVMDLNENIKSITSNVKNHLPAVTIKDPAKPPAKAQVVGWPPVRSYRKNVMSQKNAGEEGDQKASTGGSSAAFVKVCMDGAPYLRKGMIDFMNERKLMDLLNSSEYVPSYEDKDGDWMLVGDVPWEMFVNSCKRLRIMKGSEAIGLAPRAMEKCKSRT